MAPIARAIRRCPTCNGLVAERDEPLSQHDDYVRCPWCSALFWFKKANLAADVVDGEWHNEALLAGLLDRTRVAQAATVREVFDALFPPFREKIERESSESWLQRARERAAEVAKTMHR